MTILANHAEIDGHAADVRQAAAAAQDDFEACRAQLASLQEAFEGETAVAFQERYDEWQTASLQLTDALNGLGQWLKAASDTLAEHDMGGARSLRG